MIAGASMGALRAQGWSSSGGTLKVKATDFLQDLDVRGEKKEDTAHWFGVGH